MFDEEQFISGDEMRRLLLNHKQFAEVYGEDAEPFLLESSSRWLAMRWAMTSLSVAVRN